MTTVAPRLADSRRLAPTDTRWLLTVFMPSTQAGPGYIAGISRTLSLVR